jgi:hypothetical protein
LLVSNFCLVLNRRAAQRVGTPNMSLQTRQNVERYIATTNRTRRGA